MIKRILRNFFQRIFITFKLSGENSLANHAAAGAYGFLLSLAPMLLLVSSFLLYAFKTIPQAVLTLLENIPFLDIIVDENWLANDFSVVSLPGISGIISIISIFWAGRLLAVSMQRGLKIVFTGDKKRNPVTDKLLTLLIELLVLIFSFVVIFLSQTALYFLETFEYITKNSILYSFTSQAGNTVISGIVLGLVSYCAYRFIPANSPNRLSALRGSIFCVIFWVIISTVLGVMLRQSKYNFLYGTLGDLIILLVNVYFYFFFFFLGAQYSYVLNYFDALLFMQMRQARLNAKSVKKSKADFIMNIVDRLYIPIEGRLMKYYRLHKAGETVFFQGDRGDEIFYLLEGEVEVYISSSRNTLTLTGTLKEAAFFGEMSHLLNEARSATIKAKTDVSVLALPPSLFDEILKHDKNIDRNIIEQLSERIKNGNDMIASLSAG